ncbi:polyketide synthase dehydratase domain-containing protein [Candidatus Laterigemmans baculatus]|uniref:polyketide synthase dehydratase domain-containing protein n=1 Tax=Candidatus Laterigemmans baculatus TaxID=2770505 RepID=UPI0013D90D5E|nr:polyketide synthase dehydratase domain-containing protein [Candidatus Laterigemmans baculatus]
MRFSQLDSITELQPGRRIVARRTLRAEEEYLRDHFPHFPVMPGVMMLEAAYQAAMWMVRTGDDFAHPLVMMREAKSVKFADFLAPGETLEIVAELVREAGPLVTVKTLARKGERTTVSARLVLERGELPSDPRLKRNEDVRSRVRKQFTELFGEVPATVPLA